MTPSPSSDDGADPGGRRSIPSAEIPQARQVPEGEKGAEATPVGNLYRLTKQLYSVLSLYQEHIGYGSSLDLSSCGPVIYGLTFHLSKWAFGELRCNFEQIFSLGKLVPPAGAESAQFHFHQCASSSSLRDFCTLLRCCINMLHLLEFDLNLVLEKCQILVKLLSELCSTYIMLLCFPQKAGNDGGIASIKNSASHGNIHKDIAGFECFSKEISLIPVVRSVLEVFADELLVHQTVGKHFAMAYYISVTNEKLLAPDCITCDVWIIVELVSAHFLLSCSDEIGFVGPPSLNSCYSVMGADSPKLSLTAALKLLGTRVIFSAPYMLQAHMILLVSRCVSASRDLSESAMDCYMSAFEQSIIFYVCYSSHLPPCRDCIGDKCQLRPATEHCVLKDDSGLPFDIHIRKATHDAINLHIQKLVDFCSQRSCIFQSRTKAETVSYYMTYIKENQHIIQEQWREEACLILTSIIKRIVEETDKGPLHKSEEVNLQEIHFLSAFLKLMGSSLLKVVTVLSEQGTKRLNDYILCRVYDHISGMINLFGEHMVGQYGLCNLQAAYSSKHKQTMLMLSHFTSLLFYSIDKRLILLWEDSIFVMMAVMNLLGFEEGNLDTARTMGGYTREISFCEPSASKISPGFSLRKSTIMIASNFQKIQILHTMRSIKCLTYEPSRMDVGETQTGGKDGPSETSPCTCPRDEDCELSLEGLDKCNGESFLRCVLEDHSVPDWDDLANFIEVRPGKDYAHWLQTRERYNKWKLKKLAVARHQRKKTLRRKTTKLHR